LTFVLINNLKRAFFDDQQQKPGKLSAIKKPTPTKNFSIFNNIAKHAKHKKASLDLSRC